LRESLHGIIHLQLKRYLETRLGQPKWLKLLEEAGACTTLPYVHLGEYPDEELGAIVAAAARATATSAETVLEGFGEFIAASLIVTYRRLTRPNGGRSTCSPTLSRRFIRLFDGETPEPSLRCCGVRALCRTRLLSRTRRCLAYAFSRAASLGGSPVIMEIGSRSRKRLVCTKAPRPASSPYANSALTAE
jgi:Haem-NO-binding